MEKGALIIVALALALASRVVFAAEDSSHVVAVLELVGDIDANERRVATQALRAAIARLDSYRVIERNRRVEFTAGHPEFNGCADSDCAAIVGRMLGADRAVVGTVRDTGSGRSIDIRLVDTGTGRIIGDTNGEFADGLPALLAGLDDMAIALTGMHPRPKPVRPPAVPVRRPIADRREARMSIVPPGRPPLSFFRVFGEVISGIVFGFVGANVGGLTEDVIIGGCYSPDCLAGATIGYYSGAPIGVTIVGRIGDETGSFAATAAAGTFLPFALTVLAIYVIPDEIGYGSNRVDSKVAFIIVALILPIPAATIAFNRTRRYDARSVPIGAVFDIDGGGVTLGAPIMVTRTSPIDGSVRREVELVRARF